MKILIFCHYILSNNNTNYDGDNSRVFTMIFTKINQNIGKINCFNVEKRYMCFWRLLD